MFKMCFRGFPNVFYAISLQGRKMVTIIDPHIKKDDGYRVYKDAKDLSLFVKRKDNVTDFEGHCWPGASEYLDFFNPDVRISLYQMLILKKNNFRLLF